MSDNHPFDLRVAILGSPSRPDVAWSRENLEKLRSLGFNTIQLNIAWGARPADEPLNLEDVLDIPGEWVQYAAAHAVPSMADPSAERRARRKRDLKERIRLSRESGLRTIFHFGAPNNGWGHPDCLNYLNGQLPRCLLDGETQSYYERMVEVFAAEYPGVDDLLMYTYDQAAWLCSEFGDCPNCRGVPLAGRAAGFVNRMAQAWRKGNPNGRLWWEPWELSAGQVLQCVEELDPDCVGLALHTNIAEAMQTVVADRWFKNTVGIASRRGIPVIGENFIGGASEEVEPYTHLSHPLVVARMLRSAAQVEGVVGFKEYYGLLPDQEDPNLRAAGLFFKNPSISDDDLLGQLAEPYGAAAPGMVEFWRLTSEGMELFPWDASWFIREVGKSDPRHALSAAFLRGYCAETPSWLSTRDAIFMKVNNEEPHPWMLEDVQLRCELAARRFAEALQVGRRVFPGTTPALREPFEHNLVELESFLVRTRAYAYHIRASNLAMLLRETRSRGKMVSQAWVDELRQVLLDDQANMDAPDYLQAAIELFESDLDAFLAKYFRVEENTASKGYFSLTSR